MSLFKSPINPFIIIAMLGLAITPVLAQEDEVEPSLELVELTVTAQKREEAAIDVPVSLVVVSSEFLQDASIEKVEDLQFYVPNLTTTESGISTQVYIRGIGTGNNQAFEQSVGQYVDDVYYGRQQLIRAPFFDLERVEVLRGPQNILFGKNSIAGAISYVTARPTQDFNAEVGVEYVPDFGRLETTAMISGGLSDTFAARIALRSMSEDGYMRNTFLNSDEPDRSDFAYRASFNWTPNENWDFLLKVESNSYDAKGRQIEIIQDDPSLAGAPIPGVTYGQILGILGHPGGITEDMLNYKRQRDDLEFSDTELDNFTLVSNYYWGDFTLTSVTSKVQYEFEEQCDCDYVGAPVFNVRLAEEYDQFSQEFRITSPQNGVFEWIGGLFYQTSEQVFQDDIIVPTSSILGLLSGGALQPILDTSATRDYVNDTDIWAAFLQGTFHFGEFRLTAGGRFTSEDKKASRVINVLDLATGGITTNPVAPVLYTAVFGIQNEQFMGHSLGGKRSETSFTPQLRLEYDLTNESILYGSWTTGFKSGGFDVRGNNTNSWEFENEESTSYEIGYKTRFAEGRGDISIAFYYTDYDDLQISQFDGSLGFNVGNARRTRVQGFELDGRYRLTENLTLAYAGAYLDHEFKDFTNGNCYNRQIPDGDFGPAGNQLCDYTGKSGQYTPKFSGNLGLDYVQPLNWLDNFNFRGAINFGYTSSQNVHPNLDPMYEIDAYTMVDMRLAIEGLHWSVALFGRNMLDEKVITYAGNVPLSGSTFGTNTFYGFVSRPRSYGVQFRYRY